jgi:hypothetical protein
MHVVHAFNQIHHLIIRNQVIQNIHRITAVAEEEEEENSQ